MNKQNFFGLLAVVMIAAVAALNVSLNSQKETLSDLAMENVEALADESSGGSNTGPGKVYDCAGWGTGNKKVCLSENSNPCSETGCF